MKIEGCCEWAVLGAGLRGLAVVGKLLDMGESAKSICWIDSTFSVVDPGCGRELKHFLYASPSLRYAECDHIVSQRALNWITEHLIKTVNSIQTQVESVIPKGNLWQVGPVVSRRVILANEDQTGGLAPGLFALGRDLRLKDVMKVINRTLPVLSR